MAQPKTTIELNGKLYDAKTGAMVHPAASTAPATTSARKPMPKPGKPGSAVNMDGFIRRPTQATAATAVPKPAATTRKKSAVATQRKPERAKTLMRHVVKKPVAAPVHPATRARRQEPALSIPDAHIEERQQRAAHITRSSSVSRFSLPADTGIEKKVVHLPVKPHPVEAPAARAVVAHTPAKTRATSSESFSRALESAGSHKRKPLKTQKLRHRTAKKLGVSNRALNIAAGTLVVVLLSGFIAYQNIPNASMRLASTRAGFHASLPGYTPSGFGMAGPIHSSPGAVTVSFKSNSDDRTYNVTQKPSDWTSDSLKSNFFSSGESPVAYQDKGRTIYIYDNGAQAAWVNGGVLYEVSGNANLSSSQVISIADSL